MSQPILPRVYLLCVSTSTWLLRGYLVSLSVVGLRPSHRDDTIIGFLHSTNLTCYIKFINEVITGYWISSWFDCGSDESLAAGGTSCESPRVSDEAIVQLIHERPRLPTAFKTHVALDIYYTKRLREEPFWQGIAHENSPIVYVHISSAWATPSVFERSLDCLKCFFFFFALE